MCRHKPLKISVRFVKTVNRQLISEGFPDATLAFFSDIFGPFVVTDRNAGYFKLNSTDESIDLAALREEIIRHQPNEAPDRSNRGTDVKEQILSFRLAEKTPLEAMTFVQKLQETIRQEAAR